MQALAVRLKLILSFDDGMEAPNDRYRTSINRRGGGSLTVAAVEVDVENYPQDGVDALLAREHLAVQSRHRE